MSCLRTRWRVSIALLNPSVALAASIFRRLCLFKAKIFIANTTLENHKASEVNAKENYIKLPSLNGYWQPNATLQVSAVF